LVVRYKNKPSTPGLPCWISWSSVIKNKTQYTYPNSWLSVIKNKTQYTLEFIVDS
jgi:hypothetical protein